MKRNLILAVLIVVGCAQQEAPTGGNFQEVPADMIMTDMTQYMTNGGVRKARLQGDTAYIHDDSGKVKVKGVNLVIYDETGAEKARLTSRTGDFNTATQAMVARGQAVLITVGGQRKRIETEELHYDPQSHRLWSTVRTVMLDGESRVTGSGFEADDKFTNVQIRGVTGRVGGLGRF